MTHLVTVAGTLSRRNAGCLEAVFERRSSCARCVKASACGSSALPGEVHRVSIDRAASATAVDQSVAASITPRYLVVLAATGYLLPAMLCVLGAWLATLALPFEPDAAALLGAACGLVVSAAAIRATDIDRWARACVKIRVFARGRS